MITIGGPPPCKASIPNADVKVTTTVVSVSVSEEADRMIGKLGVLTAYIMDGREEETRSLVDPIYHFLKALKDTKGILVNLSSPPDTENSSQEIPKHNDGIIYFGCVKQYPQDGYTCEIARMEYDRLPTEVQNRYVWMIRGYHAWGQCVPDKEVVTLTSVPNTTIKNRP